MIWKCHGYKGSNLGYDMMCEPVALNKIKNQESPGKAQISTKTRNWPVETICLPKMRFFPKTILSKTKTFLRQKIQKWKICLRQKNQD